MRVIFMGTPDFSVAALKALLNAGHDVVAVYTQPPRPAGRGKKDRPSPVHQFALENGLEVRHPNNFKNQKDIDDFTGSVADVAVVVAYGLLLPQMILDAPKYGCLNIHASLLPRWRGAAPIHRAIMAGDKETGIGIMQMEAGLDTGPVLIEKRISIDADDTTGSLHNKLSILGAKAIAKALDNLDTLRPTPQSDDGITYANKIDKSEAHIDWNKNAETVKNHIHGLSPFPGAWTMINNERLKILTVKMDNKTGTAGTKIDEPLVIACQDKSLSVVSAQRAGKGPMNIDDLVRGFDIKDGSVFS